MFPHRPATELPTHTVTNQVPELAGHDRLANDVVLTEGLSRLAGAEALARASAFSKVLADPELEEAGRLANAHPPELHTHDRFGHRIDEVSFHPSYHRLFTVAMAHGVHNAAWATPEGEVPEGGHVAGGHVTHLALEYLFAQVEAGICCPLTMTYAVVPTLRREPALADWAERVVQPTYDGRMIPGHRKASATMGMAMTEKQGGSDIRANTTRAVPEGAPGRGQPYRITGHKWFCSAPMSDAFLTLAHTDEGLSCFFVPRWLPDDTRNPFFIQRLKDKLGNRSNASSEIEYLDTWGLLVGEPGRGVRTILSMVHHTRLDCTLAAAGLMRAAFVHAVHHAQHRKAFGKRLVEQPLMRNVLADLALETEAATLTALRVAQAYDAGEADPAAAGFARAAVAVGKYWVNKRCTPMVVEAMECLGGAGYVEESGMPRLYKEAPLNGIWEGSGNVICLDVLRAMSREPEALGALRGELMTAKGANRHLDALLDRVDAELADHDHLQFRARRLTESLALALQGSQVVKHSPEAVADAWCASRLGGASGHAYGTLPPGTDVTAILQRAWPALA